MKKLIIIFFLSSLSYFVYGASRPIQYVCIAFDGSSSLEMWDNTIDLAKSLSTPQTPVHFTYFINSVYFLEKKYRKIYHPPVGDPGTAPLDFPDNVDEIEQRVLRMNKAFQDGNELASHTAGHRFGAKWSVSQWQQEFDEFNKLLFHYKENNQLPEKGSPTLAFGPEEIQGFRAPGLSYNDNMFTALRKNHFLYDTSRPINSNVWPKKEDGLWLYGMPSIVVVDSHPARVTFAMDYNFYQGDTNLQPLSKVLSTTEGKALMNKRFGSEDEKVISSQIEESCYKTLKGYFEKNYYGNRAPVQIGFHFTLFQGGAYYRALKRVVTDMSKVPEVRLVSYKELTKTLEATPADVYSAWTKADFPELKKQKK